MLNDFPEDLRQMDEKQFLEVVEWLKTLVKSREIAEMISKKPQLILPIRIVLDLTRYSFSRKVSINFHTLKRIETRKIKKNRNSTIWGEKVSTLLIMQDFLNTSKDELIKRWKIAKEKNFEDDT